ncbi:FlxA-like family protein [Aquifex aeolicus]|uniref:Uncharacterized protein aq_1259 n=1 Tax=Aquifex aeolicus (strain VF5) TaxID=224324 RepID=Y1259_AQUAE|nr:RecName: Full=Uncharacterized protein aq_1259; Flags: Precursor [Aquifex aeolicus VF5]AAC07262.1 putative protein [Aquifex aeolicus VF5]
MMKRFVALSMAIFSLSFAQDVDEKIKALEEQIESLQKELQELKKAKEETEVLKEEFRKLRLEIVMPEAYKPYAGLGPAASKVYQVKKGVSIGGYGELHYINNPDNDPSSIIDLKRLILYFGYSFTENLKFNSEIEIEHAFVEGGEESGELAVEFAYLDYNFSPKFGLRGGMLLIPVGIVNELHEPPTFPTVDRPYLERNIIPTTWSENGIGIYGDTDLISYRAYIVNGMKAEEGEFKASAPLKKLRQNGGEAVSDSLAFTGRIDFKLPNNLTVGASTFISGVQNEDGKNLGNIYLFSPHLWWQYAGWDVRFVGAYATVSDAEKITLELSSATCDKSTCNVFPKRMQGFYLQVAYNILRHFDTEQELYVFGVYENYDTHASVPSGYEKPKGSEVQIFNFGISYKPHPLVALKADYVREDYKDKKDNDIYRAAITWMF